MEGWATIKKAAKYADVSERTFRDWLKNGLKHSRLNAKTIRIRYSDIDEFLERFQVDDHLLDDLVDSVMRDFN
jgi:excisionase family DNA binding protein